jgi:hypothetical protein
MPIGLRDLPTSAVSGGAGHGRPQVASQSVRPRNVTVVVSLPNKLSVIRWYDFLLAAQARGLALPEESQASHDRVVNYSSMTEDN